MNDQNVAYNYCWGPFFLFVLACVQTSELSGSLVRPKFFEEEPS